MLVQTTTNIIAFMFALTLVQAEDTAVTKPGLPDNIATGWITALRSNDLSAAYGLLTQVDQERAEREWKRFAGTPDAFVDVQLTVLLNLARQANGAQQLAALAQPLLAQVDPPTLSKQVTELSGFLALAAKSQTPGTTPSLDYAGLHKWLKDIADFIPKAGLTDQAKLKLASEHLTTALRATALRDAAEIRDLDLATLLKRCSPALSEIKAALEVYDIKIDQLLDSFGFSLIDATPTSATLIISFKTMGKARSFPLKLVTKSGSWSLADGADNPIAALSQLVMMSLLMQGMGAGAPAQPPSAPVNDGAL
jgi:hypothetical protein